MSPDDGRGTDHTAVAGASALRLRGVRVSGHAEPVDLDVPAGSLLFLPLAAPAAEELLRVLAGERVALAGEVTTLAGRAAPGERVLVLCNPLGLPDAARTGSPLLGVVDPHGATAADAGAAQRVRQALHMLTLLEGRTVIASGQPFAAG